MLMRVESSKDVMGAVQTKHIEQKETAMPPLEPEVGKRVYNARTGAHKEKKTVAIAGVIRIEY